MQVQIRGITSINANASPLYIVDGVMVNNETINSGNQALTLAAGGSGPNNEDNNANRIADLNPDVKPSATQGKVPAERQM